MVFNSGRKMAVLESGFLESLQEIYLEISRDDSLTRYEQQILVDQKIAILTNMNKYA